MSMKNLYLITLLFLTTISQAQIVTIPDVNFKNALVNTPCVDTTGDGEGDADADTNDDGEIQVSEAESVLFLSLIDQSISSLEGIKSFTNIEYLNVWFNQLSSLDVTKNTMLKDLNCVWNSISDLDVTQNPMLEELRSAVTQISNIDLSQNPNLRILDLSFCPLQGLDVTQNPNLELLGVFGSQLTSLDVTQNPNLQFLSAPINQLTSLDVTQNPNLVTLFCYDNQLTSLDLSQNTNLERLICYNNQLSSLDIKNGNNHNMMRMWAYDNPNLECIQVDDETATYPVCDEINYLGWCKDDWTSYSEDCSLATQDFNQISFTLYPNPTQDILNIDSQEPIDSVQIYSINGSFIKETSSTSIGISELPAGLYFAQINIGGNSLTKKFVKY